MSTTLVLILASTGAVIAVILMTRLRRRRAYDIQSHGTTLIERSVFFGVIALTTAIAVAGSLLLGHPLVPVSVP